MSIHQQAAVLFLVSFFLLIDNYPWQCMGSTFEVQCLCELSMYKVTTYFML